MIDFLFMEFYIKKKYDGMSLQDYFNVNIATVSKWRTADKIPGNRVMEFSEREGSIDVKTLINQLY